MIKLIKSTFYNEKKTKRELNKFIANANILSFSNQSEIFEENFSKYQQRRYGVFVNSGSSANLAIIQALLNLGKIKKGDKVAFSALTWSTNVMPLIQLGLKPVPVDVELDTLNISSEQLKKVLNNNHIKLLFITNLLGFCDDIDEVARICRRNKIILIEDNCESLGSVYKGKLLGNFGLASTFSFYVGHHMSTVEGGMVATNNKELATMLRVVRAHGWDRNLALSDQKKIRRRFKVNSTFYSRYTFYDLGFNFRPTDIAGFLGNNQLQYLNKIVSQRQNNFKRIASVIYRNPDYHPIRFDHMDTVSNFAVPVICKSKELRAKLVKKCNLNVEIRPVVGGDMTQQPFYQKHHKKAVKSWENSNAKIIHERGLYFGNNPDYSISEIKKLINYFKSVEK